MSGAITFIGLGTMGGPMAGRLRDAGHEVIGHDVSAAAMTAFAAGGGCCAESAREAVSAADAVITMLPEGDQVRQVYETALLPTAPSDALLLDCSTIDVATARDLAGAAAGRDILDAPVSGGVEGARAGTLTFMVGGPEAALTRARPLFEVMGRKIVHMGAAGSGQAAKACHNMICGITMVGVAEAFALAGRLGLSDARFFELCRNAAARSWVLENRCPRPGPAPDAPASRDYAPGFAARLMAKDLGLAQAAAQDASLETPLGAAAAELYRRFVEAGGGELDMSAIIRLLEDP